MITYSDVTLKSIWQQFDILIDVCFISSDNPSEPAYLDDYKLTIFERGDFNGKIIEKISDLKFSLIISQFFKQYQQSIEPTPTIMDIFSVLPYPVQVNTIFFDILI